MFVGVLPQQVHWRDPNLVITIPMIMTALKSSGLFQFALFTVIVITFKFSLQALFTMPEHWTPLYGSTYSIATHNSYCDIYFSFFLLFFPIWWIICTGHSGSCLQKAEQDDMREFSGFELELRPALTLHCFYWMSFFEDVSQLHLCWS